MLEEQSAYDSLNKAVALHFDFAEDECCDPPTYSRKCDYRQVCHECGQDWPCDTVRVATGQQAVTPPRRPSASGEESS